MALTETNVDFASDISTRGIGSSRPYRGSKPNIGGDAARAKFPNRNEVSIPQVMPGACKRTDMSCLRGVTVPPVISSANEVVDTQSMLQTLWKGLSALGIVVEPDDDEQCGRDVLPSDTVIDRQPAPADLLTFGDTKCSRNRNVRGVASAPLSAPQSDLGLVGWLQQYLPGRATADDAVETQSGLARTHVAEPVDDWITAADQWDVAMTAPSMIITPQHAKQVAAYLPYGLRGATWHLTYSTYCDGTSLQTLYRRCGEADEGAGNILIVKDERGDIFGGFTTEPWQLTAAYHHSGRGESFLFRLVPHFKAHRWTGRNGYFMMAERSCLHMGLSNGRYALWLDETLTVGHCDACDTFANGPLREGGFFKVVGVEVWSVSAGV